MAFRHISATQALNAAGANTVTNTWTIHASTDQTITVTTLNTVAFTAPNLTNKVVGVIFYVTAVGTAGTLTFNFQEATVTKASIAVNVTDLKLGYNFAKLVTPFTFTSVTASNERWQMVPAGITGTLKLAADSAGTSFSYQSTDDRTTAMATTDNCIILAPIATTAITVTVTGTAQLLGSAANGVAAVRLATYSLYVGNLSTLQWDTAASATLTLLGSLVAGVGGTVNRGTVASPYPSAFNAILNLNNTAAGSGVYVEDPYGSNGAVYTEQGVAKSSTTLWKTLFSSGLGTAASPLITTDAVAWSVGDEIYLAPTDSTATNYANGELRFIITVNSSTSYVISGTSGGTELALANTHTAGDILNVQRNVLTKSTSGGAGGATYYVNDSITAGNVAVKWSRWENTGQFFGNPKEALKIVNVAGGQANCDYFVVYKPIYNGMSVSTTAVTQTWTGLICVNQSSNPVSDGYGIGVVSNATNQTFVDCFCCSITTAGFYAFGPTNTFTRCKGIACAGSSTAAHLLVQGGFEVANANCLFNNCEAYANRTAGVMFNTAPKTKFVSFLGGVKGINQGSDISGVANTFVQALFTSPTLSSTTPVANSTAVATGSYISLDTLAGIVNNHVTYYPTGIIRSTGTGLTDTTVRNGSYGLRMEPANNTTGLSFYYLVPAIVGRLITALGFLQKNATFGTSTLKVELYLPGNNPDGGTADATQTMSNTTGSYLPYNIAAVYSGSVDGLATVKITGITSTASAYAYLDDIANGTNTISGLNVWYEGKPSAIIPETLGDAAAVWAVASAGQTTGTMGKIQSDTDLTNTLAADKLS